MSDNAIHDFLFLQIERPTKQMLNKAMFQAVSGVQRPNYSWAEQLNIKPEVNVVQLFG